jgi:hypothetical protein
MLLNKIIFILTVSAILVLGLQSGYSASSTDKEVEKIKKVWASFVERLSKKDIEGAFEYIVEERREGYRMAFSVIKDKLPKEMSKKEEIKINEIDGNIATGENIVKENGGEYSYPVIFIKERGKWKIQSF